MFAHVAHRVDVGYATNSQKGDGENPNGEEVVLKTISLQRPVSSNLTLSAHVPMVKRRTHQPAKLTYDISKLSWYSYGMNKFVKGHIPSSKGKHLSEEHRRKIGESSKGNSYALGKKWNMSEEGKKNISLAKKGKPSGHKGMKRSEETKRKISKSKKDKTGVNSFAWKGSNASYSAKHAWIVKHYGNPEKCEYCGSLGKRYQWANISKEYKREREDYIGLCTICHMLYDKTTKLIPSQIVEIRRLYASGEYTQTEIANKFQTDQGHISNILNRKRWKHL